MATLQQVIDRNLQIPYGHIGSSPLASDPQLCREVQQKLHPAYYRTAPDGIYGPLTRAALRDFKEEKSLTGGDLLGPTTAKFLCREGATGLLPPPFPPGRDNLVRAVIQEGRRRGLLLSSQIAYVMATVQHEVAGTYQPIREYGGARRWYAPYYGRGYVQLTHRSNYQKYSQILGVDLVGHPDRALEPRIALFVLVHGMANGTFTGRRLGQYVNVNHTDFYNARRVVNGLDRAQHLANLARQWVSRLNAPPWEGEAAAAMVASQGAGGVDELSEEGQLVLEQVTCS